MRISDWSSDVCSSDLGEVHAPGIAALLVLRARPATADRQHLERRGAGLEFALEPRLLRGSEHGLVRIVGLYDRVAVVAAIEDEEVDFAVVLAEIDAGIVGFAVRGVGPKAGENADARRKSVGL